MRACLRKAAPKAEESLKWGMPAFSHKRILFTYAGFRYHIGFYPTPSAVRAFAKDLSNFKTAKGSIQFPLDKPLPLPLIRKIAQSRKRQRRKLEVKRFSRCFIGAPAFCRCLPYQLLTIPMPRLNTPIRKAIRKRFTEEFSSGQRPGKNQAEINRQPFSVPSIGFNISRYTILLANHHSHCLTYSLTEVEFFHWEGKYGQ